MKPINQTEIQGLKHAIQYFQDCYLVSSIGALTNSTNGRKILQENIAHTNNGYFIKFKNINGKPYDFFVSQKETDDLIYTDKYMNPIPINPSNPHNPIIKAIEVAMNKLLNKFPLKKPLICRIPNSNEDFEFNKPSNFLEMFTGKKPIILNEGGIRLSLKSKEKESRNLFDKISEINDNSFVAGTSIGFDKNLSNNHCYSVKEINKQNNKLAIFDHRCQEVCLLTYEEALKKLKFLVGYFNQDLI